MCPILQVSYTLNEVHVWMSVQKTLWHKCLLFKFEADRRAFIITINSFGTELGKDDRNKLYPKCGKLYPEGLSRLAKADDYEQVRAVAEYYSVRKLQYYCKYILLSCWHCSVLQAYYSSESNDSIFTFFRTTRHCLKELVQILVKRHWKTNSLSMRFVSFVTIGFIVFHIITFVINVVIVILCLLLTCLLWHNTYPNFLNKLLSYCE